MTARLRVAVAGSGYFSQFHLDAWTRLAGVELCGLCSLDEPSARSVAANHGDPPVYSDFAHMLDTERPDVVDIVTPPATHLVLIAGALDAGAHVICQKPFCASPDEARKAVKRAEDAGRKLVVHENFRFQPWYRKIKALLDDDVLGEVYQATFRMRPGDGQGPEAYLARQPYFQQMPRFLVHETAVHWIDTFRLLFGDVTRVFADLRRLNPAISGEDAGVILFDFENGRRCLYDGNRLSDHPAKDRRLTMGELIIDGSAASLRLDGNGRLFLRPFGENEETEVSYTWQDHGFGGDCVYALNAHVISHLQSGTPLENEASNYIVNQTIEEAVYHSAKEGCWIEV